MPRLGLTVRLFVALLVAVLPPLFVLLLLDALNPGPRDPASFRLTGLGVLAAALGWVAVVSVLLARIIGQELRSLLTIAERGARPEGPVASLDGPDRERGVARLTAALDERNRQVAELAAQVNAAPIAADPRHVATHIVRTARSVTRDETWVLAILGSSDDSALPPGTYGGDSDEAPGELTDLHRWAAVAEEPAGRVRRIQGPWGAFVAVRVAAEDELRATLLAPWEGRADPSSADIDLLSLVGQHAAAAIEHALLYATVRRQADELDRMGAVQRDFLRAVTHDLQSPLTSIRALARELGSRPEVDAAEAADLDLIEHQADRLRRMVQQLLAMSRLEAGAIDPRQEVFKLRPLIERTWAGLRAEGRELRISVEGEPLLVVADPDRLEQVLWALLDNAVKYSPAGTPVEVAVESREGASRAVLRVSDEGSGMDAETAERAFNQFYRSADALRLAPDGSGIGLYTARGLVRAMGGDITIESRLGGGTTLVVELHAEPVMETAEGTGGVPGTSQGSV